MLRFRTEWKFELFDEDLVVEEEKRKELCDFQEYLCTTIKKYSLRVADVESPVVFMGKHFKFVLWHNMVGNTKKYILDILCMKDNQGFRLEGIEFITATIC